MKNHLAIILLLLSLIASLIIFTQPINADSQAPQLQWDKTYGPYMGFAVTQTADGGYAIAGQSATYSLLSHGPPDWVNYTAVLIKVDKDGNLTWKKTYEAQVGYGLFSNGANSIVQTKDIGYLLSGDDWLLKLDSEGNVQWNKTFDTLNQCQAIQTSDDGYALIGNTNIVTSSDSVNSTIVRMDQSGNILWNVTFSREVPFRNDVIADSLVETNDDGFAVAGSWAGSCWFAEVDSKGFLVFNQTYSLSAAGSIFTSVSKTNDDGYILAGYDVDETKDVAWTAWIVKTNSEGKLEWKLHFEHTVGDLLRGAEFRSIKQTDDGGYVAVGYPALVKLDSYGNLQWNQTTYNAYSVTATKEGGFLVAGGIGDPLSSTESVWAAKFSLESGVSSSPSVPEFPTWIALPLLITALAAFAVSKKVGRK